MKTDVGLTERIGNGGATAERERAMNQEGWTEEGSAKAWGIGHQQYARQQGHPRPDQPLSTPLHAFPADSLVCRLAQGKEKVAISFAGQGSLDLDDLARLYHRSRVVRETVQTATQCLQNMALRPEVRWSGALTHGIDLEQWLREPTQRPAKSYLQSPLVSQVVIFIHQICRYRMLFDDGLSETFLAGAVCAITGHSQGIFPALLIGQSKGGVIDRERFDCFLRYIFWQGLTMASGLAGQQARVQDATPMASIAGPDQKRLQAILKKLNTVLPSSQQLVISLYNTPQRHVVSAHPLALKKLEQTLQLIADKEAKEKQAGKRGGTPLSVQFEYLSTSGPYHSHALNEGLAMQREKVAEERFRISSTALLYNVYSPATGTRYNDLKGDFLEQLMQEQYILPVQWHQTVSSIAESQQPDFWLDLGPGDGVLRLAYSTLKGTGTTAISISSQASEDNFLAARPKLPVTLNYKEFAPSYQPTATNAAEETIAYETVNRYTEWTGMRPIILPGMTPTTADVPIVAAAANAGFTAELAGGGQVTEAIFWQRMEELKSALEPGREVVFNALYMDRYLWDLHLGKQDLVVKARRAGYPICGVTVTAGLPEVEEAVALLDKWVSEGIWLNAFKPGTLAQIKQVIKIAKAAPHHKIIVHLEGGKAGGHHSWESLDGLMLDGYHSLREQPNVLLCVGGGIGSTDRAVELLQGTWSLAYQKPIMPVDGVFLGTLAMACLEAKTSPQVKQALVDAKGSPAWVNTGKVDGAITSGKSQLNADIHYIDNPAARCGRLLDQVAGNVEAVAQRRDEIIEALNATAKPYIGDLHEMTYARVAEQMCRLMAIGKGDAYEDGRWLDTTHRMRFLDFLHRTEARLTAQQEGTFESLFPQPHSVDVPEMAIERLRSRYPQVDTTPMHPADVDHFIHDICARPGKPVNFVPVIDENVRRWYKSDSLWQAHHEHYKAEQVLIIPGPEAVMGLNEADEPVASLLGRMDEALLSSMHPSIETWDNRTNAKTSDATRSWPVHYKVKNEQGAIIVEARGNGADETANIEWLNHIQRLYQGPLATLANASHIRVGDRQLTNPLHQICLANSGAQLHLDVDQTHRLTSLHYFGEGESPANGVSCCHVALQTNDEGREELHFTLHAPSTSPNQPIQLRFTIEQASIPGQFQVSEAGYGRAIRDFYLDSMGIPQRPEGDILSPLTSEVTVQPAKARGYAMCTGLTFAKDKSLPMNMAFSVVWEPLMRLLTHETLAGGLLQLVHLDHEVEVAAGWPLIAGESLQVEAQIQSVEDAATGRVVRAQSTIMRGGQRCGIVRSGFMIRGNFGRSEVAKRSSERQETTLTFNNPVSLDYFLAHDWLTTIDTKESLQGTKSLHIDVTLESLWKRGEKRQYKAQGLVKRDGIIVGSISMDKHSDAQLHPVTACLTVLSPDETPTRGELRDPEVIARDWCEAPSDMTGFAAASGDHNAIHQNDMAARLAGLPGPIVHGMWTAARSHAFICQNEALAAGDQNRVERFHSQFLAPVMPGEMLRFEARRKAIQGGKLQLQVTAMAQRDDEWQSVLQAEATITPPKTAYIFPGQGIQQAKMGMDGYARSSAAREVWDRADAFTRARLGFSILHVVRDNPKELIVDGVAQVHPKGVIHLTQFTQVAMAVLAQAQTAELRERGALVEDAVICGHSVGEYNAIGALGILPLEDIVSIVYQRGMVMHKYVPRDASGESGYRMAVLRPHYAGMDHQGAEEMVAQIREETGFFIEIVNYNVRNRQYAVTGEMAALRVLQQTVESRAKGNKSPYLEVPGIDVPFHSSKLRQGVTQFRQTLEQCLPKHIDLDRLCGKYIPNLVPQPFTLARYFVQEMLDVTGSSELQALLELPEEQWVTLNQQDLGRTLLIELLAWQFTSPVRWIETQEQLLFPSHVGGMSIEHIIEIGVGYQPTLANMARYSHRLMGTMAPDISILNVGAETAQVFQEHALEVPEWPVEEKPAPTRQSPQEARQEAQSMVLSAASKEAMQAVEVAPEVSVEEHEQTHPGVDEASLQGPMLLDEAFICLLALQAKVRPEQIDLGETLDDLFAGVSSRRNQVLMDLGAEFSTTPIDGAHEMPLRDLQQALRERCNTYQAPGTYLKSALEDAIKRGMGSLGINRNDIGQYLQKTYGVGKGLTQAAMHLWMLDNREGKSGRGGELGQTPGTMQSKEEARKSLDHAVRQLGQQRGCHIPKRQQASSQASQAVDASVVRALEDRLIGPKGLLTQNARLTLASTQDPDGEVARAKAMAAAEQAERDAQLALYKAEYDETYHELLQPRFHSKKHVAFTSSWSSHRRDISALYFEAANNRLTSAQLDVELQRLSRVCQSPELQKTAAWYARCATQIKRLDLAQKLSILSEGKRIPAPPITPVHPETEMDDKGQWRYREVPNNPAAPKQAYTQFVEGLWPEGQTPFVNLDNGCDDGDELNRTWKGILHQYGHGPHRFEGQTAVVTGASPNSIALACVRQLLRGGARVIVTTSTYTPERIAYYRGVYEEEAAAGAELHVVPFNQASHQDVDAFVDWLFGSEIEQSGGQRIVRKRPFIPNLFLPFAAIKDLATLDQLQARAHAVLRSLLTSVERMIAAIGARFNERGRPAHPMHVILPMSPNHGTFGGDGLYAEAKAALEVLCNKWHSERATWANAVTLCGARIGWVRGTGLMDDNNLVAAGLETEAGIRTFSSDEMGLLLTALCTQDAANMASQAPLQADLAGGFELVDDLPGVVGTLRQEMEKKTRQLKERLALNEAEDALLGVAVNETTETTLHALPNWPAEQHNAYASPEAWPAQEATLQDTIVIVGAGEVGPCGNARTRFALEVSADLSPAAVVELAWMTGLIQYRTGQGKSGWYDVETDAHVPEETIVEKYRSILRERVGIRTAEPAMLGFDPAALPVMTSVFLDQDLTFSAASEHEAQAFVAAAPESTHIHFDADADQWLVTRRAGTEIRVPRQARLSRQVVGCIPTGFDFSRYGIPQDMIDQIDRLTLFNLVATIDAFVSAGLSPEELLSWLHPTRVANTQGSGIGGMQSLHRLYVDHLTGTERQGDQLQETLINVVAAHVVQSYVGSYGAMSHPVAACATAAISLEEGMDKLMLGKADFVVTGGYDDLGSEGMIGFSDMNATADSDQMTEMGIAPHQMSRGNDARRRGFVEAQGGGTILMTRGDIAVQMGLPVMGVLAYTGSFGDGINKSIPAPGLGALGAVTGGEHSPLAKALKKHGLTTDDIALVYKHDTSTAANDPNENRLHQTLQESLGRTQGNPLFVVSQKSLTGHSKGGAAAWQTIGLCQSMSQGIIPGNRNLDCVDDAMRHFGHMAFTNTSLYPGKATKMKAGLLTSLGFGHVSGIALILHPDAFLALLDETQRKAYNASEETRQRNAQRRWADVLTGHESAYERRQHRRFKAEDGSVAQREEEIAMLLDTNARYIESEARFASQVKGVQ